MGGHLKEDVLMDALEGAADEGVRRHLEDCAACGSRLAEAQVAWALAGEAGVPEPSPFYWEGFRRGVDRRIGEEGAPRRGLMLWWPALVATAAGVVAAVTFINPNRPALPGHPGEPQRLVAAWAIPAEVTPGDALDAAVDEAALGGECEDLTECLMDLSEEEAQALADILDEDLGKKR